jgi:hypothetical protein
MTIPSRTVGRRRLHVMQSRTLASTKLEWQHPPPLQHTAREHGESVKAPRFNYVRAESLEHAIRLLAEHGDDARILAGGQSLMPKEKSR